MLASISGSAGAATSRTASTGGRGRRGHARRCAGLRYRGDAPSDQPQSAIRASPADRPATPGPRGVSGARVSGGQISGGSRADAGSFLQPPVGGRGSSNDDLEHRDRDAQQADHIVGELPLVAPAVIGETSAEEHRSRGRDGR